MSKKVWLLVILFSFLTGCSLNQQAPEVPTNTAPTLVETSPTINPNPYPSSSETFDLTAESLSGSEADLKIKSIGTEVANEYLALRSWYIQNGIKEENLVPLYYNGKNGIHWDLGAKADDGNFLSFTLTSGPEKGQLVRSVGLVAYLYSKPSFITSELQNPPGFEDAVQQIVWDESGWSVAGLFTKNNQFVGWLNADKGQWSLENVDLITGPESSKVAESYPTTLSVDEVKTAITSETKVDVWPGKESQYVSDLVAKRTEIWKSLGLNLVDNTKDDYVQPKFVIQKENGTITAWDYVLYDKDGGVAQWLQVKDSTGNWQWAKTDMWGPSLATIEGESQYSLPEKLISTIKILKSTPDEFKYTTGSTNRYDIVFIGKDEILVEYDKDGNAKRWLDVSTGKMEWLDGVDKIIYIDTEEGTVSFNNAAKIARLDGEAVYYRDEQQIIYNSSLFKDAGIEVGGPPGYDIPKSLVAYWEVKIFACFDDKPGFGLYIIKTDGAKMFIYKTREGITKIILGVTKR